MKLNCGPTAEEKQAAKLADRNARFEAKSKQLGQWHQWFAWFPVRVASGDCRWLETVERRGEWYEDWFECGWNFEYRPCK